LSTSRRVATLLTITNTGQPVNFITDYHWYTLLSVMLGLLRQPYLGKVGDMEAMRWIGNLYG